MFKFSVPIHLIALIISFLHLGTLIRQRASLAFCIHVSHVYPCYSHYRALCLAHIYIILLCSLFFPSFVLLDGSTTKSLLSLSDSPSKTKLGCLLLLEIFINPFSYLIYWDPLVCNLVPSENPRLKIRKPIIIGYSKNSNSIVEDVDHENDLCICHICHSTWFLISYRKSVNIC